MGCLAPALEGRYIVKGGHRLVSDTTPYQRMKKSEWGRLYVVWLPRARNFFKGG